MAKKRKKAKAKKSKRAIRAAPTRKKKGLKAKKTRARKKATTKKAEVGGSVSNEPAASPGPAPPTIFGGLFGATKTDSQ